MTKIKYLILSICLFLVLIPIYHYSPYKPELLGNYPKIWAHRVNSTEKLNAAIGYYEGVELDLVYVKKKNYLDVNHPPEKSINLSFEDYLSSLPKYKKPFLWLDIKNLSEENSEIILKKISSLLAKKAYPLNKILVESSNSNSLPIFSKNGYTTSYYLPYGLTKMKEKELKIELVKIKKILKNQPTVSISSDIKDYNLLKEKFPTRNKYLWSLGYVIKNNFKNTRNALKDPYVQKILVSFYSFTKNR